MMERVELLAPAKDLETGMAAINSGADAVYIGGAKFGAREAAGNSLDDIRALVNYAHKYWARIYVTVNTLLYDAEIEPVQRLINDLYEAGADALIIQDVGLLELDLPPLPLFASTQMHNHTPERVAFLEKVGIQRAILARELSIEQIRAIRAKTTLELETFIHGALCVSYSGQCYMSYALGGRSGNRGQCAQPCRRPYQLLDKNGTVIQDGRYLLSLKDFNATKALPDLLDAGVRSFKIEGRLKDVAYVRNVVGYYRQQLDRLLEGKEGFRPASSGKVVFDFQPNPLKTFNRGFTSYFLYGRKEPVGSPDTPKALGEPLGRVARLERSSFILDSRVEIHRADGLCFFNSQRELVGTIVNEVAKANQPAGKNMPAAKGQPGAKNQPAAKNQPTANQPTPLWRITPAKMEGLAVGTLVFRNHDHEFISQVEKSQTARKMAVRFRLAETRNGLALFAQDEDGNEAMQTVEVEKTLAEKPEQALATIEKQLGKLGGTEFECSFVRIDLDQALFVPLGVLNGLRRAVLEDLTQQRLANYPRQEGSARVNTFPFPETELSYQGNVLNEQARTFYRRHGVTSIAPAAESGLVMQGLKVMTTKHCIKHQMGWCLKYSPDAKDHERPQEPLTLRDEQGNRYPLRFNCAKCEMEVYFQEVNS